MRVFVGALECDVLLGDVHSLKQKRAVVRPVLAQLRRLEVAAARRNLEAELADLRP